jgi:hypothetical protein
VLIQVPLVYISTVLPSGSFDATRLSRPGLVSFTNSSENVENRNNIIAESAMRGPAIRTPASLSSSLRPSSPPGIPVPSDSMFALTQLTHKKNKQHLIYYEFETA